MPFQKGNKLGGRRSSRKSDVIRIPPARRVQQQYDDEDEVDEEDVDESQQVETPQEDGDEEGEEEEPGTPAQDDDEDADSPPTITTIPRRTRGRGRGRGRGSQMSLGTPEIGEDGSESGTPWRRRGRKPGVPGRARGGFRGRRRGAAAPEVPRVVDKDGNLLDVVDDSAVVDDDPEGNEKVDADGNLQGGREYRVRTFKILGKGDRLYMLSTEPARCCGFRDSYLFFTKHPKLFKVLLNEEEKKDLIDRDILPSSYRGRNIGVVTARSVFREFGARIIVGGRRIVDDYKVAEARANGDVEGELADPQDRIPDNKEEYNRNRYVAWFGASDVYRTAGAQGGGAVHPGKPGPVGKRRNNLTVTNWQLMHAREASRFNNHLTNLRHATLDGVYDTHTNMMFYPTTMQPTHARWEQIPPPMDSVEDERKVLTNGLTNGDLSNGDHSTEDKMDVDSTSLPSSPQQTLFTPVPAVVSRNYTVIDTAFTAPPLSHVGYPGPDGHVLDPASGTHGLASIPDDILDELPEDCRQAFEVAREAELRWKHGWGTEHQSAMRGQLKVGLSGYPV